MRPILTEYCLMSCFTGPAPLISMIGSIFSHSSAVHLMINMYVLRSVANVIVDPYQLAHIYLTGGKSSYSSKMLPSKLQSKILERWSQKLPKGWVMSWDQLLYY